MYKIFLLLLISFVYTTQANAHGGGLDSNDCHQQNSDNTYHCHPQKKLTERVRDAESTLATAKMNDADVLCVISSGTLDNPATIDGIFEYNDIISWKYDSFAGGLYISGYPFSWFNFSTEFVSYTPGMDWIADADGDYLISNSNRKRGIKYNAEDNTIIIKYGGLFTNTTIDSPTWTGNWWPGICKTK
mgnify:FL=1|jgi:hypothetical protein